MAAIFFFFFFQNGAKISQRDVFIALNIPCRFDEDSFQNIKVYVKTCLCTYDHGLQPVGDNNRHSTHCSFKTFESEKQKHLSFMQ